MKRREFITLLGSSAAVAWPLALRAEQPTTPTIGLLAAAPAIVEERRLRAFRQGLGENGYSEGQNLTVEYLRADGHYDRLPEMAADLVRRRPNVIVTPNSAPAALAAKAATRTIPIVFSVTGDPVKLGLVATLHHPGGNATGVNFFLSELGAKRLGLLHDLVPSASLVAVLVNPTNSHPEPGLTVVQTAARALGIQIRVLEASNEREIDMAIETASDNRCDALLVINDPFFTTRCNQIVMLAARRAIPAIYSNREYADAGGLISYGTDIGDVYQRIGVYTGQILKGARPADLPVVQSTRFELIINLNTARALGLNVPPALLAAADEVIE